MHNKRNAFTLIELLIVVAIIGILAAIAIPNFLEAQTRAKVARNLADMRTVATAITTYMVDYNATPPADALNTWNGYWSGGWIYNNYTYVSFDPQAVSYPDNGCFYLTTPIAYLSSFTRDPFNTISTRINAVDSIGYWFSSIQGALANDEYSFATEDILSARKLTLDGISRPASFMLTATGPDGMFEHDWPGVTELFNVGSVASSFVYGGGSQPMISYDPTNGTISGGDIIRIE